MSKGSRVPWFAWLVLLLLAGGCTRDQDYIDVAHEQQAAWREVADILRKVKDEKTMADAEPALEATAKKYADTPRKANALPKPPPARVIERLREEEYFVKFAFDSYRTETARVSRLPGGDEFLKKWQSNSSGLFSAVQP